MLRNINQPKLGNGTRLSVKKLMINVIKKQNFDWAFQRWRCPMIPTDISFQFKRLQFPIRLAFAITINKAQGQSLELCGLYLHTDFAFHMGNYMLPVPESAIQTISLSTRKLELPRILCIHKYWKIKHIRNMHFFFFPHSNKLSHSNAWPGTASIYICIYIYIYIPAHWPSTGSLV